MVQDISLIRSAITTVMTHFATYPKQETDCIKYLPSWVKLIFLKKFLYSKAYSPKIDCKYFLSLVLNDKITVINLSSYYVDNSLMKSLEKCTSLEILHLDQCTKQPVKHPLQEAVLINVLPSLRKLVDLRILNCDVVTDAVIIQLIKHCAKLEKLGFSNCKQITDEGFIEILKLERLIGLDLSGSQISDYGLSHAIDSPIVRTIQDIRLDHCKNIKEFDFTYLVRKCTSLEYFSCLGYRMQDTVDTWTFDNFKNLKQINWTIEW